MKRPVACSLCGRGGGTLRRVAQKRSGVYVHMGCLEEGEKKLWARLQQKKLEKYLETLNVES